MNPCEQKLSNVAMVLLACSCTPVFAQSDPVAAAEIRHLRELIAANDRLYGAQFEAQKEAVKAALAAAKEATSKAESDTTARLASVNEFRGQLKDQAGTFVTRAELWGYFVGTAGLIVAMVSMLLRLMSRSRERTR